MNRALLFILLLLAEPSMVHAETITLSFEDLPTLVSGRNKNVLAGQAAVDGAKSQTGHLERSFLPKIRAEGGGEIFQTGNSSRRTQPVGAVEGRLNLFRGGQDLLEGKILKTQENLAQANLAQGFSRELARSRFLFSDAVYYGELLRSIQRALATTQGHIGLVRKQIQSGLTTESDRLEFDMFHNQLKRVQILAHDDYEHALEELKAVLGWSQEVKIKINDVVKGTGKDLLSEMKFNPGNHHEFLIFKKKGEIAELHKKQSYRWWTPSLEAYGGYALYPFREREYPALWNRDESVGGLKISVNLFDALQSRTQGKAFQYQAKAYKLEAEQKSRELEAVFEKLEHELKSRRELIRLLNQNVRTGQQYLKMSSEEYGRGVKTGPQLLEASQRHFQEMQNLAETRREQFRIQAELMALLGR